MRRLAEALFIAERKRNQEPESENYAEPDMFMVSNPIHTCKISRTTKNGLTDDDAAVSAVVVSWEHESLAPPFK